MSFTRVSRDPREQTPIDQFEYLTRIHYLAPSGGMWDGHEGAQRCLERVRVIRLHSSAERSGRVQPITLFLTADVTVTANANEIHDYKYVDKD